LHQHFIILGYGKSGCGTRVASSNH